MPTTRRCTEWKTSLSVADDFSPFAPTRLSRIKARRNQVRALFDQGALPADDLTVAALVIVLHDAAQRARVPVVMLVRALAALDGADVTVRVTEPETDEDEQLIGGPAVN